MQAQQNIVVIHTPHQEIQQQAETQVYDFSECRRIKKLTTHDIYRFTHQNVPLVVKLFAPEAFKNYQQEVSYLTKMTHKQVLKIMYKRKALNPNACEPLEKCHLIVLKQAKRGDLNEYLPRFGKMTQKMARTFFIEMVQGLKQASQLGPKIIHPNLQATSILLGQNGQLYICGWSQITHKDEHIKMEECIFSCAEILICLLTSFMPFYKKYSVTDQFYKFINPDHIHKFWEQLEKSMNRVDKKFKFPSLFKLLVEKIFLKKMKNFDQILNDQWVKGEVYTLQQLNALLQQNQQLKNQKLQAKKKIQLQNEEKRKKAIRDFQLSYGLQRSSETGFERFIKDYQANKIQEEELPNKKCNIKVEGSPGFIVASLLEFLRQQNGKASIMVAQQFVLSKHNIVKVKNQFLFDLFFQVLLLQEEEEQSINPTAPADTVNLKLKLSFSKAQQQVYAEIQAVESNFNTYYTNVALQFLQGKITDKKQSLLSFKKK